MLRKYSYTNLFSYTKKKMIDRSRTSSNTRLIYSSKTDTSLIETIYEHKLQDKLTTQSTLKLTHEAIHLRSLKAIELLADSFPHTVTEVLQFYPNELDIILESSSLVFQLKEFFSPQERDTLLKRILPRLVRQGERIFKSIDRSKYPEIIPYLPGMPWNIGRSIFNFLISGDQDFTYNHVICVKKRKKQHRVVLLIDKSHSVLNYLRLIIITSILFSLSLDVKDISLIGFDSKPEIIKGFKDKQMSSSEIIQKLLNLKSGGKTDISAALHTVQNEFKRQITTRKSLVMISDLLATSGEDFIPILKEISDVRIILTPRRQTLQLTKPLIGQLRKLPNIRVYSMTTEEQTIPKLLERVLYD